MPSRAVAAGIDSDNPREHHDSNLQGTSSAWERLSRSLRGVKLTKTRQGQGGHRQWPAPTRIPDDVTLPELPGAEAAHSLPVQEGSQPVSFTPHCCGQ